MHSVIMLNVASNPLMHSVITLNVIMPNVVAPLAGLHVIKLETDVINFVP